MENKSFPTLTNTYKNGLTQKHKLKQQQQKQNLNIPLFAESQRNEYISTDFIKWCHVPHLPQKKLPQFDPPTPNYSMCLAQNRARPPLAEQLTTKYCICRKSQSSFKLKMLYFHFANPFSIYFAKQKTAQANFCYFVPMHLHLV